MRIFRLLLLLVAITAAACGGGADSEVSGAADAAAAATTSPSTPAADIPPFAGEFERVCTTQVGFEGVAAYEGGPGPHPLIFFNDHRGEGFVKSSQELPAGWTVEEDMDYDDNSDLQKTELIACNDRVKEIPTGVICDFENDGDTVKLELVDADYDLKVYAASTGELKHEARIEARNTDCPVIVAFKKDDTTHVNQPTEEQLINGLKPVVTPA